MNKIIISGVIKEKSFSLILYPLTDKAFFSIRIDEFTQLQYGSSMPIFAQKLKEYLDVDWNGDSPNNVSAILLQVAKKIGKTTDDMPTS